MIDAGNEQTSPDAEFCEGSEGQSFGSPQDYILVQLNILSGLKNMSIACFVSVGFAQISTFKSVPNLLVIRKY